ncbi:MAG: hypothetical protein JWO11_2707, partial [Nocardioides sp.]|nr:hypothetical protein [Nocardioides sp.]
MLSRAQNVQLARAGSTFPVAVARH